MNNRLASEKSLIHTKNNVSNNCFSRLWFLNSDKYHNCRLLHNPVGCFGNILTNLLLYLSIFIFAPFSFFLFSVNLFAILLLFLSISTPLDVYIPIQIVYLTIHLFPIFLSFLTLLNQSPSPSLLLFGSHNLT